MNSRMNPGNKCNNNCLFNLYWEYYLRSSHRIGKLDRYLNLGQYLPVQIKKPVIIAIYFHNKIVVKVKLKPLFTNQALAMLGRETYFKCFISASNLNHS